MHRYQVDDQAITCVRNASNYSTTKPRFSTSRKDRVRTFLAHCSQSQRIQSIKPSILYRCTEQPSCHAKERRGRGNLTKLIPPISPTFSSDPTERFTLLKDRGELTSQRESRSGGIGGVSERVTEQTSFACCHRYVSTWPGGVKRPVFSFRSRLQGTAARLMHGI